MNRNIQLTCAWSGPLFVALWLIGMWPIQGFLPAPEPSASADAIVALYRDNLIGVRLGTAFEFIAVALFATFGGVIASRTRRAEGISPVIAYVQIACVGASTALATVIPVAWAVAAFRPGVVSPDITLTFNDFG